MARITIPRVVRPLRLGDYQPEYGEGEAVIWVWANPTRKWRDEWVEIILEISAARGLMNGLLEADEADPKQIQAAGEQVQAANARANAWLAAMWSQHADAETHWTAEEVDELARGLLQDDPALWLWLQEQTHLIQAEYRKLRKKK